MSNPNDFPGSRWWKFDFHTHTPASSDYGSGPNQQTLTARTPREWIMDFIKAGVQCVAVTDHHCGDWIDRLKLELELLKSERHPEPVDFHLFPGVELSINGVHYLAIFDPKENTTTINTLLALARYDRNPENAQGICEETNATKICEEVESLGGLFIPAHVDLESSGLFRNTQNGVLRPIFDCEKIIAMETAGAGYSPPEAYQSAKVKWATVLGSDSHHPSDRPGGGGRFPGSHFTWVKMGTPTLDALRLALHDGNEFSILRSDELSVEYDPNQKPEEWLESIEVTNAKLMGRGHSALFNFSPWMNAIIGGRGSGKSTLIHLIRLVCRREEQLIRLGEGNRVLRTLENFKKISSQSSDDGALLDNTRVVAVYRKGNERYRITWLQGEDETTVESYDSFLESWLPASSQEVTSRFPVAIFSQDEMGLMAENPSALLQRVDEVIGKADWDAKWEQVLDMFLNNLAQIRTQRTRIDDKDRLKGELEDVIKKIKVLESSEHEAVFKNARKVRNQQTQIESLFEAYDQIVSEIRDQCENLLLDDPEPILVSPDHQEDSILTEVDTTIRAAVTKAAQSIAELTTNLEQTGATQRKALADSDWEKSRQKFETEYKKLMDELEAKGIAEPSKLTQLTTRRQTLEKSIKDIEGIEKNLDHLRTEAANNKAKLLELRRELQQLRSAFLDEELKDNRYVRIQLRAFGSEQDMDRIERELRAELGCEDTRFADAIRNPEKSSGIIEELYQGNHADEEARIKAILATLQQRKIEIIQTAKGKPSKLPGAFQNFLKRAIEHRPEYFDRLHAWWPEDSLEVSYSKDGVGHKFVSLRNGSAGEKAAALLAFFLAHGDHPLIIDQPENDLDNHLITHLVVSQLRQNKARRQIIVVTHNPNIVVNGDAEMVHAMRFSNGQCKPSASGPLQNGDVRTEVCEVMEGGKPALKSRYQRLI